MAPLLAAVAAESSHFVSAASLRRRLDWFNKLRWGAALGVPVSIFIDRVWIGSDLPVLRLLGVALLLLLLNLGYVWRNARVAPVDMKAEIRVVKLQMLFDLALLTVLLHFTGGIENPMYFLFLIHVIIASLLFKGGEIFQIACLALVLFTGTTFAEYLGWLPHHHQLSASERAHELPFILASLVSFWFVLLLSAYIGSRIMNHNRAIKDELVARQEELVAADRAKMEFFRFVTHEVKSPLATAQSAVETALELGGAQMQPSIEDLLSRALGRLEQAGVMVKDLGDLTRGGMVQRDQLRVVDLKRLVQHVAESQGDLAARRDQRIELDLPERAVVMTTSGAMVEKILTNLVNNAVRYNREGGQVTIRLQDLGRAVRLEVRDEGIGIEPQDHERIFEEFYRSDAAQRMSDLGTGLGLAIVRRFVQNLGGTISLRSTPGAGSTFTAELPRVLDGSGGGGKGEDPAAKD